jgi:hypothetical protein
LIRLNGLVPFAVREGTDTDRLVSSVKSKADERRYGFVTEIHLRGNFRKQALKAKQDPSPTPREKPGVRLFGGVSANLRYYRLFKRLDFRFLFAYSAGR